MVSTYLNYNLVNRDLSATLKRVQSDTVVARESTYYKENIGKVSSVDEFMGDYRLYAHAMKAHGLEDMIYAKAFMKKVLESDLTDKDSYANRLTDDRYRKFAAAFSFTKPTSIIQTTAQEDATIGLYKQTIAAENDSVVADNAYYSDVIDKITSVDDLLANSRAKDYVLKAFGIDGKYLSDAYLKSILTSDVNDPGSYVNTLKNNSALKEMASNFSFQADGTVASGQKAQTDAQKSQTITAYTFVVPSHMTKAAADLNKAYMQTALANATSADAIVNDSRLFSILKTAFGLPSSTLKSTFTNIITSDLSKPDNYAATMGGSAYTSITAMFNFQEDGSLKPGMPAQTATQTETTVSRYMTTYDDKDTADDEAAFKYYRDNMVQMDDVDELAKTPRLYDFVLKAYGLDPDVEKESTIKAVLKSDLTDPNSAANKLKDPRYLKLAEAFNIDKDGKKDVPLMAQNEAEILTLSKEYIVMKTRFGNADNTEIKKKAEDEAKYYREKVEGLTNVKDFLADKRLVNFVLEAKGIDPKTVKAEDLKLMFASDLNDPDSFVNAQPDKRFVDIVASFNFNPKGDLERMDPSTIQSRAAVLETEYLFANQTLEEEQGNDDQGVRLALYFQRKAPTINTAYDILADQALLQVFRTAFSLPAEMSSMKIENQAALVEKNLKIPDLQDPDKLKKFMNRFVSLYDLQNDTGGSSIASLFNGSSAGISADTLLTLNQLR